MIDPFIKPGEWVDFDIAATALFKSIGLYKCDEALGNAKWVWWVNNLIGNKTAEFLDSLVKVGILEKNDDNQFRIKEGYDPTKFSSSCATASSMDIKSKDIDPIRNQIEIAMNKYYQEHSYCPRCGGNSYSTDYVGYIMIFGKEESYKDENRAYCICGWKGIVHDLTKK